MFDLARIRLSIFGISDSETTFVRRGFAPTRPAAQERLESIGRTFVHGYRLGLAEPGAERLASYLDQVETELRGFAYEGAAMALALLDELTPWRRHRFAALLRGAGDAHAYMLHVGAGWAAARIPWAHRRIEQRIAHQDPLLGWLALDGLGFHQGYFHPTRHVRRQEVPRHLSAAGRRVFDQGLGRSLWFVEGADVARVRATVGSFSSERHIDLWSGVGLACAYAGGAERASLEELRRATTLHQPAIGQGVAFAAKARARAGTPADHTDLACNMLCGMTSSEAAAITDRCLEGTTACLPANEDDSPTAAANEPAADEPAADEPTAFEKWRSAIQQCLIDTPAFTREVASAHHG